MSDRPTFQFYLHGLAFPANRRDVLDFARLNNAPDNVVAELAVLPERTFNSMPELIAAKNHAHHGGPDPDPIPHSPAADPTDEPLTAPYFFNDPIRRASAAETETESGIVDVVGLPIPDYDNRTEAEIASQLDLLSTDEIRQLRAYEILHRQRATLLHAFDARLGHAA